MTKHIGITGGIGTGKSYVSKVFKALGVPFYDADDEAKKIMSTDPMLKTALKEAFGEEVYFTDGSLNRAWLSQQVFQDKAKLELLNSIVHPIVIEAGRVWSENQRTPYTLKEAALLYESKSYLLLDATILVTAPLELRIQRVMQRDQVERADVIKRIDKQMPEEDKMKLADYIIINDGETPLLPQIEKIHQTLLSR